MVSRPQSVNRDARDHVRSRSDRARPRHVVDAAGGGDHELVGGDGEVGGHGVVRRGARAVEEEVAPRVLELQHLARLKGLDRFPVFGRAAEGDFLPRPQRHLEEPGAPERAARVVAAALLDAEQDLGAGRRVVGEGGRQSLDAETQRRQVRTRGDLVATVHRGQHVRLLDRPVQRGLVRADVDLRPQTQPNRGVAAGVAVVHVHGVLPVGQRDALLDDGGPDAEDPDGQPRVEAELPQVFGAGEGRGRRLVLLAAQAMAAPVGKLDLLRDVVEHHQASVGRGQGGDKEAVKPPRGHAADRSRRVAAEAVGDQPLLGQQVGPAAALAGPGVTAYDFLHDVPSRSPAPLGRSLLSSGQGSPAGSSACADGPSSTVLSPGRRQPSAESSGNVPLPP